MLVHWNIVRNQDVVEIVRLLFSIVVLDDDWVENVYSFYVS